MTAAPKMAFEPTAAVSYACFSYLPRLWPFAMLQTLRQSTWRDGMFSLKTFVAAMLALFIAFRLDLSQPSWSVTTVYIVSQPFSGMVLAKSLYRSRLVHHDLPQKFLAILRPSMMTGATRRPCFLSLASSFAARCRFAATET